MPDTSMWECKNCGMRVRGEWDSCPHCHASRRDSRPASDSQSKIPSYFSSSASAPGAYISEPANNVGGSWASKFLIFIAVFLFIAGIFVAWQAGNVAEVYESYYGMSSRTKFSFGAFLIAYIPYLLGGAFSLCASELFENIQRIADSLSRIKTTKK